MCADEIDSYMYQSVGHSAIDLYAEAMGLPLYRRTITGSALATDKDYTKHPGDEVEDLFLLLQDVQVLPHVTPVVNFFLITYSLQIIDVTKWQNLKQCYSNFDKY